VRFLINVRVVALTAAFLMAAGGTASATTLTSPAGTAYTGVIKAESQGNHLAIDSPSGSFPCGKSSLEWNVESHGAAVTAKGPVSSFTAKECGTTTVTIVDPGEFELHTRSSEAVDYDPITWVDFELTIVTDSIFGSIDCTYAYNFLQMGAITSSKTTGQTARLKVDTAPIPSFSEDPLCSKSIRVTADYTIPSPDYLDVD
jgi:hypothetical protein